MAAKTRARSQDFLQRFWSMLSYACSELCVIILLYVAAAASYAATRLACICRLRAPCTLCSRLDHALHHGKPWFSADLVCAAHRLEISSLAYCKSHSNLARSDDLCKRCLHACTIGVCDEVNSRSGSRSRRLCSCCSEPFKKARNAQRLSETANVVESSGTVLGSEEINRRSQVTARDSNLAMPLPPKVVPEQVPADHPKEKTFVVGIEEVSESDASPGTDEQSTKDNGASADAGAAKPVSTGSSAPTRIFVDRNSSIKNAFIGRVNLPSPRPSEIISARDNNSTTQQEVKAFLSRMSSARSLDTSWTEGAPSPGINVQIDESNGNGRRPSLERNYSVQEPSDGNLADEAEGESSLENLKKQLDLNKKSMGALHKELEEERSASAVAASQAMAMINRLHEEKAAMQMEALQYLRMMEEQADHDHEAIQNLHDLLTEREKELLDINSELENCRRLLQDAPFNGGKLDATGTTYDRNVAFEVLNGSDFVGSTMSGFEDEKAYILESLSRLEEKLNIFTNKLADDAKSSQDGLLGDHTRADDQHMENSSFDGGSSPMRRGHPSGASTSVQQNGGNEFVEENHKDECSCSPLDNGKLRDATSLKDEISLLNKRLKALEADQKFLKQVLSSLKCSPDGLQCVQEITGHLLELRRVVAQ